MVIAFLVIAALVQARYVHLVRWKGAQPDLTIVVVGASASLLGWRRGAVFGLIAGLLSAALFPINFGTQIASSTLGGAVTGWLPVAIASDSPVMAIASGFLCAFVTSLSATFFAPSHHLRAQLVGVGGEILYNTLVTIPVFYIFRALKIGAKQHESLFGS